MSRVARIVVPGFPHHITQRGNRQGNVFVNVEDRRLYLSALGKYGAKHGLAIWSYCLMANHVHFIVAPATERALSRVFHDGHSIYSLRFNERNGLSGHVFQGRFYSTVLDEEHLWAAVRYVERNPVRAGIVDRAEEYHWSSASAHCSGNPEPILANDFPLPGVIGDWPEWLCDEDAEAEQLVRQATRTGRPWRQSGLHEAPGEDSRPFDNPQKAWRKTEEADPLIGSPSPN